MIVTWLLDIVGWCVGLFPAWSPLPDGVALSTLFESWYDLPIVGQGLTILAYLNHYLPIEEGLSLIAMMVGFWALYMVYLVLRFIWSWLPFGK